MSVRRRVGSGSGRVPESHGVIRESMQETTLDNEPAEDAGAPHLIADHVLNDLGARAVSSGLVTVAAQGAKFLLNLFAAVALARMLSPQEFGLVAMVTAVTTTLGMLKDGGLSTVTIQRQSITHSQVSNLFWINVVLGAAMSLVGVAFSPIIAWFYGDSRLTAITLALSLTFLLASSTVQHSALLVRQMRFKAIAVIEVGSLVAGLGVGCGLAFFGFTYWSLVGMQLATGFAGLVLTWSASGWRPALPRRGSGTGPLVSLGALFSVSQLVGRLAWGSDNILLGKFYGPEALGLYSRAGILLVRPLEQILSPIDAVVVPVLSRVQRDPERYRRIFLLVYETIAIVTFPVTALFLVLSRPLILVLLGPAWEGAVVLFQGFTLTALYMPLYYATTWLFTSQARGQDGLQANIVLSVVTVLAYVAGLPYGPPGVVLAASVSGLVVRLPLLYYLAGRSGPVGGADLWRGFWRNLPCWGVVYAATSLTRTLVGDANPLAALLACGSVGLVVSAAVVLSQRRQRSTALYGLRILRASLLKGARGAAV